MKRNLEIKFVVSLIFAILVAIFAIQNAVSVEINFLFARFTISQALIILISAIVGAIVVLLISLVNQMSQRKKCKDLAKEVDLLNEEIEDMKKIIEEFEQDRNPDTPMTNEISENHPPMEEDFDNYENVNLQIDEDNE